MNQAIVSRDQWLDARKALLAKERAMTHQLDALRAERRQLPWVRIEKPYVFEGPEGKCTLGDLFRGRSQLAIYNFMLTPGSDNVCRGCSRGWTSDDPMWCVFRRRSLPTKPSPICWASSS